MHCVVRTFQQSIYTLHFPIKRHAVFSSISYHVQIARRRRAHQEKHPDAKIISLGIGDTTEPIPKSIAEAMQKAAAGMGTTEGYSG